MFLKLSDHFIWYNLHNYNDFGWIKCTYLWYITSLIITRVILGQGIHKINHKTASLMLVAKENDLPSNRCYATWNFEWLHP